MRPIITQDSVSRLPRIGLLLLCVLYGLPGFFGHDPWRDTETQALMAMLAEGGANNLTTLLGRLSITAFSPMMDEAQAARVPFLLLLWGSFAMLWYACYHFARHEAAQPAALPFGGEALTVDYARAVADGSLLAFMACLGLAEKGHQATGLLGQLFAQCLLLYGLAAHQHEPVKAPLALLLSAALLCGFGAAGFGLFCFAGAGLLLAYQDHQQQQIQAIQQAQSVQASLANTAGLAALGVSALLCALAWVGFGNIKLDGITGIAGLLPSAQGFNEWLSLLVWFLWPAWLIVVVGIWRLRTHRLNSALAIKQASLMSRLGSHLSLPLLVFGLAALRALFAAHQDDALFIALPPLAICAALMLALMPRSMLAAIDWFALALFTGAALLLWLLWTAAQTGTPTPISNNISRFYPGFREAKAWPFQLALFAVACCATLAWLALMVWRTSRARKPLWKGMVLTAGGVTLTWLLLQTLGAPMLNASRSYAPLAAAIGQAVPQAQCIQPINLNDTQRFLLSWKSHVSYDSNAQCAYALVRHTRAQPPHFYLPHQGWTQLASLRRPTERDETFTLFKRTVAP
jgi:hypothetical protein